jgi:proteasome accessory factor A
MRIFGLRNAYSVVLSAGGPRQLPEGEAGRRLFGPVASGVQATDVLLRNGGRLHLEAASRPEYGTPECGSVPDLVVQDKAGERILEGLLEDAGQRVREEGDAGGMSVLKASADPAGRPYGCQEEYLLGRGGGFGRLADILIPFLITRQLICGAGAVARTPHGTVYCLSRAAGPAGNGLSPLALRSRPFISTRDEPRVIRGEPRAAKSRRLLVAVSESNMSETTTLLKAGATDLVLRMAEAGTVVLPGLVLDKVVRVIGEVSSDITGRSRVGLAGGRQLSALDIQREYLARAKDFADSHGADAVSGRVLALWERVLDAIGAGNLDAIAREIDWVIKYQLIERYRAEHDVPLSAPGVAQADLAYHDIRRGHGLYYQAQRSGAVERTTRDIDIFEAKTVPPAPLRYRQAG